MDQLAEHEALVGVALCAAYADGTMGAEEDERLTEALGSCRALKGQSEESLRAAMQKADRILSQKGEHALLTSAAASLRPELRATAFCLGADLVLADEDVAKEEEGFVERLRVAMAVDVRLARDIVDVLTMRNRA